MDNREEIERLTREYQQKLAEADALKKKLIALIYGTHDKK